MSVRGNLIKGNNVSIADSANIEATNVILGDNVVIKDDVNVKCLGDFILGDFSILDKGISISCNNFKSGKWLYTCRGIEIGRGGCRNPESNVYIGDNVGIFENTIINPNSEVHIGDNTGIGSEVMIWTHGAWLNPLEGFPKDFGPVKIGSNVWLPARCIVLPNVSIGDNSVIGINSLVNRDIPSGSLAAGIPIKVIKDNFYPKKLSLEEKISIVDNIIKSWKDLIKNKQIEDFTIDHNNLIVRISYESVMTRFDLENKVIDGYNTVVSEDFRDFLRRNGIKIYTKDFFKSI